MTALPGDVPITREDAEKLRLKNLANIIRKANAGKTLTGPERALIEAEAAGVNASAPTSSAFAANWDQLADRLGISRRGLGKVRSRFKDADDLPEARADGRHDVEAWLKFFRAHNIHGAAIDAEEPGEGDDLETLSEASWRKREIREKVIKLQIGNARERRELIPLEELQERLPQMLMAFNTALNNLSSRAAQKLEGVEDYNEILEILEAEIDVLKKTFADCPFLDEQPVDIASESLTPSNPIQGVKGPPPAPPSEPFDPKKLSREKAKSRPTSSRGSNQQPKSQARSRTADSRREVKAEKRPKAPTRRAKR